MDKLEKRPRLGRKIFFNPLEALHAELDSFLFSTLNDRQRLKVGAKKPLGFGRFFLPAAAGHSPLVRVRPAVHHALAAVITNVHR